jgi:hypothetical protein
MFYFIIIAIVFIFLYIKKNHIVLKFRTFLKKGFLVDSGAYGVYCYCGKQGSGKTYSAIEYLLAHKDYEIYSNVKSIKGLKYHYISNFNDLLNIENSTSSNIIIFYDEIFSFLSRNDKMSKDVLSFLSQMRKRKIIFITTAQEWLEINITLRRYVRFQVDCSIYNFFNRSFLIKVFRDGDNLHWDNLENDYVAPVLETSISKMNLIIANSYDTYETIKSSKIKNENFSCIDTESLVLQDKRQVSKKNPKDFSVSESQNTTTYSDSLVNGRQDELDTSFWGKFKRKDLENEK